LAPHKILFKRNLAQPQKYYPTKYLGYTVFQFILTGQAAQLICPGKKQEFTSDN